MDPARHLRAALERLPDVVPPQGRASIPSNSRVSQIYANHGIRINVVHQEKRRPPLPRFPSFGTIFQQLSSMHEPQGANPNDGLHNLKQCFRQQSFR